MFMFDCSALSKQHECGARCLIYYFFTLFDVPLPNHFSPEVMTNFRTRIALALIDGKLKMPIFSELKQPTTTFSPDQVAARKEFDDDASKSRINCSDSFIDDFEDPSSFLKIPFDGTLTSLSQAAYDTSAFKRKDWSKSVFLSVQPQNTGNQPPATAPFMAQEEEERTGAKKGNASADNTDGDDVNSGTPSTAGTHDDSPPFVEATPVMQEEEEEEEEVTGAKKGNVTSPFKVASYKSDFLLLRGASVFDIVSLRGHKLVALYDPSDPEATKRGVFMIVGLGQMVLYKWNQVDVVIIQGIVSTAR